MSRTTYPTTPILHAKPEKSGSKVSTQELVQKQQQSAAPRGSVKFVVTTNDCYETKNPLQLMQGVQGLCWCPVPESNQGHEDFQSTALPTELTGLHGLLFVISREARIKASELHFVKAYCLGGTYPSA